MERQKYTEKITRVELTDQLPKEPYGIEEKRLSIYFEDGKDNSFHIQFKENADKAHMIYLLRSMSDMIHESCKKIEPPKEER